jgi:hypothetical protein
MKTILMHYLSSVYFFNKPLHVSGIFVAHHQEVLYIQGMCQTSGGCSFLMLKYTDLTQNTSIQSRTVTEIMARE